MTMPSKMMKLPCISALMLLGLAAAASARLGETEAQSNARYGEPNPELVKGDEAPLIAGAKELAYLFEGWRVRVALVGDRTHKIQYVKVEGGAPKQLKEEEIEALLEAEKGTSRWREQKPRLGNEGLNKLKETFEGRHWERGDNAVAKLLHLGHVFEFESRDAEKIEKQLAKTLPKATPVPKKLPGF
jgi:hypothetical protein